MQSSTAAPFSLFPREEDEASSSIAVSAPNPDTYDTGGAGSRSGSPDRRGWRATLIPVEEDSTYGTMGASSIEPEIRGTGQDTEDLDPRYAKRLDAKRFFVVGRVFALLWHENAGESNTRRGGYIDRTTVGRFGSRTFSQIRRMAVVNERKGYCVCIPIHT